jgi:iron complex transport system permease protein
LSSRFRLLGVVLGSALLLGCVLASLGLGARPVPADDVVRALLAYDGSPDQIAVRELRLPRTVVALMVGVALGVAGVLMQGLTRNPVADPGLFGVSAGAALGVVAAVTLVGVASAAGYVWFALVGALVAGLAVFYVSARRRGAPVTTMVLAGAAVSATLSSVSASILAVDQQTLDQYRFWAVGSLQSGELSVAVALAPVVVSGLLLAAVAAPGLDALALGDDVARALGRKVGLTYLLAGTSVVVLTGAAVAAAGPIAFVGLVVPHLVRPLAGPRHGWLLLHAAMYAPAMVLAADVLGRLVVRPAELPVGIVLALVGAPFLVWLVRRDRARDRAVRVSRREAIV